jgi:hypothetical protein
MPTIEELQAEVEALKKKNAEILDEKKSEKRKAEEAETARKKAEEERDQEKSKAEEEKARKDGDWKKLEETLRASHAAELKKLQEENGALKGARDKLVIDGALSAQLDAAGVKPEFKPAVAAMIRAASKAEVEIDASGSFAGKIDGKPIDAFVKDWAASDQGKHFILNANAGGGANGSGGGGAQSTANPYKKETRNLTKQGELEKTNPDLANKLRAEAGLPALAKR